MWIPNDIAFRAPILNRLSHWIWKNYSLKEKNSFTEIASWSLLTHLGIESNKSDCSLNCKFIISQIALHPNKLLHLFETCQKYFPSVFQIARQLRSTWRLYCLLWLWNHHISTLVYACLCVYAWNIDMPFSLD